jgi:excisionase family DNA binding protein
MDKLLLSIPEFANRLGIGPSLAKKLVREGRVLTVKIGDRRLIPVDAVDAYIKQLVATAHPPRRSKRN